MKVLTLRMGTLDSEIKIICPSHLISSSGAVCMLCLKRTRITNPETMTPLTRRLMIASNHHFLPTITQSLYHLYPIL